MTIFQSFSPSAFGVSFASSASLVSAHSFRIHPLRIARKESQHFSLSAFQRLYVLHGLLVYWIVRRMTGLRWSSCSRLTAAIFLPLIFGVFSGFLALPNPFAVALGILATLVSGLYSLHTVSTLLPAEQLPSPVRTVVSALSLQRGFPWKQTDM